MKVTLLRVSLPPFNMPYHKGYPAFMISNFIKLSYYNLKRFAFLLLAVLMSGCAAKRNLVYMSNLADTAAYRANIANTVEPKLQPGDILSIVVTNVDPETSNLLNKGLLPVTNTNVLGSNLPTPEVPGYLVDKSGDIIFPVAGKVKVAELTVDEAAKKLGDVLGTYVKKPIVAMRVLNFKITVIGEVSKPGIFNIPNAHVNVFEALGLAGDMTVYGKRENVSVIHEEGGVRTVTRIDLNTKEALQSPVFYLRQNDIVYIKPDKLKERQARTDTRTLSIIVAAATVITVIISRLF
jgi:polysaccharide export outer membrane protein